MGKLEAAIFTVCLSALYAVIIRTAVVCLKKTDEREFWDTLGSKIAIVLSNLVMAGIEFWLCAWFVFSGYGSDGNLLKDATKIYTLRFVWYMVLLAIIYCMPMINLLLYRLCYIKTGISRRWVIVPFTLIFGGVSFFMLLMLYDPIVSFFPIALTLMIFIIYFFTKIDLSWLTMLIPLSVLTAGLIFIFNYGEHDWSIIIDWIKIEWVLM